MVFLFQPKDAAGESFLGCSDGAIVALVEPGYVSDLPVYSFLLSYSVCRYGDVDKVRTLALLVLVHEFVTECDTFCALHLWMLARFTLSFSVDSDALVFVTECDTLCALPAYLVRRLRLFSGYTQHHRTLDAIGVVLRLTLRI